MMLAPGIPTVYRAILVVPDIALENSMACRVYRAIKLGLVMTPESMRSTLRPLTTSDENGHELAFKRHTINNARGIQVNMDISKTADLTDDGSASLGAAGVEVYNQV